ncbi:MAG TPA: hypothetical protein VIL42_02745 [Sphingomicrobium sp.]|jgi:hypothetical protein
MYLVEVESAAKDQAAEVVAPGAPSDRWEEFPYSRLSHHGDRCCEMARQWVVAMDFAQLNGASVESGPRWLREKYKWGPSPWPMHWCDVVERDTIDCGAHAALALEVFAARGLAAFPAQLVQKYSKEATDQWRGSWEAEEVSCHWLDGEHIYHEATAVLVGTGELKVWDGSAGSWVNPRQRGGYGSVLSIRVFADSPEAISNGFRWGEQRIAANRWQQIG